MTHGNNNRQQAIAIMEVKQKNLELDRLVFFCDAIVAIAITLLALGLNVSKKGEHLAWSDLWNARHQFAAFFLSFIMIAILWTIHHRFFVFIKEIDRRLMIYNIGWLLFVVLVPFSSSLISDYFFDKVAMLAYCINIFAITCFQNMIWDYAMDHKHLVKESLTDDTDREYRTACNLAMANALLAIAVAFFSPLIAFLILLSRSVMFQLSARRFELRRRAKAIKQQAHRK